MQHHLVFVNMKYFFMLHQLFFVDKKYIFMQHQHVFVEIKLLFVQRQTLYFNTKLFFVQHQIFVLDIIQNVMSGDIFLLSHSNKSIITCHKINKLSFLCDVKKLFWFFVHHHIFIFSFCITHCQHVDLLRSGPGNKETFNPSFTHLPDTPKPVLSKSCS